MSFDTSRKSFYDINSTQHVKTKKSEPLGNNLIIEQN